MSFWKKLFGGGSKPQTPLSNPHPQPPAAAPALPPKPAGPLAPASSSEKETVVCEGKKTMNNSILEFFETDENRWRQTTLVALVCITLDMQERPMDRDSALFFASQLIPGLDRLSNFDVVTKIAASEGDAMRHIAAVTSQKQSVDLVLVPTVVAVGILKLSVGILTQAPSHRKPTLIKINAIEGMGQILRVR